MIHNVHVVYLDGFTNIQDQPKDWNTWEDTEKRKEEFYPVCESFRLKDVFILQAQIRTRL